MLSTEQIAFLIRETGWTLEYIRGVPLEELYLLIEELNYQKQVDDYRQQINFAALMSAWSGGKIKATDLVGQPPQRGNKPQGEVTIWSLAEQVGIRVPKDTS